MSSPRSRWLARAIAPIATATSLVIASAGIASATTLVQLSRDPYHNTTSQHRTELEPDTFAAGSTIVSTFQVGRFFSGGASNIGFATSTDGGASFTAGFLPATTVFASPPGPYPRASDPSAAFDAKHGVWLISYLGVARNNIFGVNDVLASRSTDGLTWGNPVVVNASGHFDDKNWTACDNNAGSPFFGNCYTEFDDNTQGDLILMSTSSDGGLTWSAAQPTNNKDHGIGGQPLVQPNGTVIVPINGFAGVHFTIDSFSSTDGGASWGTAHKVATVFFHHAAGGIRDSIPLPSAEIDASGKVYVVWQDCRFEAGCAASDLVMTTTSDGVTWSSITRIPVDPLGSGVDHFIPGLAVDSSSADGAARLALAYYFYPNTNCTTSTCQLEIGSATSGDGGASWRTGGAASPLAGPMALTWLPNTSQGFMVGDYISTSFSGAPAYPAFAVANPPSGSKFDEAIYTVAGGLSVSASAVAATDQNNTTTNEALTGSSITSE